MGSVLGLALSPAVAALYRMPLREAARTSLIRASSLCFLATMGFMAVQTYSGKLDEMSVDDRAYRIAHNKSQREVDRLSCLGAAAGLALATVRGRSSPRSLLSSCLGGVALSVGAYAWRDFMQKPHVKAQRQQLQKKYIEPLFHR